MKTRDFKTHVYLLVPVLFILGVCSMITSAGCGSSGAEAQAEKIVVKFFEYLYEKDYGSAIPLCTERCLDQYTDNGKNAFRVVREDHDSGGNIYTESKLITIEHGDNTIEIYSEDAEDEDEDLRIWLIREKGKWLIDEFEWREDNDRDRDRNRDRDEDEDDEDRDRDRD